MAANFFICRPPSEDEQETFEKNEEENIFAKGSVETVLEVALSTNDHEGESSVDALS